MRRFFFYLLLICFLIFLVGCQFNNPFLDTELEDLTPYLGVHKYYFTTNLQRYPILGYFPAGSALYLNGNSVSWDSYRGYRLDVDLSDDINHILLESYDNTTCVISIEYEIKYDPEYNTENHAMLYSYLTGNTIVYDFTQGGILGIIPSESIVSYTPDGKYVAAYSGNIYSTATHTLEKTLSYTNAYPVFVQNGGNTYCYVGSRKIDFETGTVLSSSIPLTADFRYSTVYGDRLTRGWSTFTTIDTNTDASVGSVGIGFGRVNAGGAGVSPNLTYGVTTSCSYARGYVRTANLSDGSTVRNYDGWSDWMGQVAFLSDSVVVAGAFGNTYYGGGGIYLIDIPAQTAQGYGLWGGSGVVAYNGRIYATCTRWSRGSNALRGIAVYDYNGSALVYSDCIFLCYSNSYRTSPSFFIKP